MKPAHYNTIMVAIRKYLFMPFGGSTKSLDAMRNSPNISTSAFYEARGFMDGWRAAEQYHIAKQEKP